MRPTPVYGARAEKPFQNADFAMKQTNICRLSGDITMFVTLGKPFLVQKQIIRCADELSLNDTNALPQGQDARN